MMPLTVYEQPYFPQDSSFTFGYECIGLELQGLNAFGNPVSATWPTANKAFYLPFTLQTPKIVYQLWLWNGATVSGNIDIGLFDESGNKLVSSGAIAQSGVSVLQLVDITDTLLPQGTTWLGVSINNATATSIRINNTTYPVNIFAAQLGVYVQASAHPLPATATYSRLDSNYIPMCGMLFRSSL